MKLLNVLMATDANAIPYYRQDMQALWQQETQNDTVFKGVLGTLVNETGFLHAIDISDILLTNYQAVMGHTLFEGKFAPKRKDVFPRLFYDPNYPENELQLKPRISVVIDVDDDLWDIHPWNTSFDILGYRGANGEALAHGDSICGHRSEDNEVIPLWEPNKRYDDRHDQPWNVCMSRKRLRRLLGGLRAADAVTVTTPRLKARIEHILGRECFVRYNAVERRQYPKWQSPTKPYPLILWRGGSSHYGDLREIFNVLVDVLKANPEARLIAFGQEFPTLWRLLPPEQFEYVEWVPFDAYFATLRNFGHNISICPLQPTNFNNGKSAIAFYENSALEFPAATLASNLGAFQDDIVDGTTGLLFNTPQEFGEKLTKLIKDQELRNQLAKNAHEWVWANRDIDIIGPKTRDFFTSLIRERCKEALKKHALIAEQFQWPGELADVGSS